MYKSYLKRFSDILLSLVGLVAVSPLILIILLILTISNNGKSVFIQIRPGKNGELFKIIKFRTMIDLFDSSGNLLPDNQRLTSVGKYIRKYSLDEIPQLINVLLGNMSLIGPRPLLAEYLPKYTKEQSRRHMVRPGMTGWAQVNGRNSISWQDRFAYDVWYVDNLSIHLDLKILYMTVLKVLKSEGINQSGEETMTAFNGKN